MITAERALEMARQVVRRLSPGTDPEHEDVVQEVVLDILSESERRPDMPERYFMVVGKHRALDALKHRTWTGMATNMGTAVDPLRRPHGSVDEMLDHDTATSSKVLASLGTEEGGYERAEWAAMAGGHLDVAIARLPTANQRAVVVGIRDGKTIPESLPDMPKKTAQSVWHRARTQLRQELAWMTDEEGRVAA